MNEGATPDWSAFPDAPADQSNVGASTGGPCAVLDPACIPVEQCCWKINCTKGLTEPTAVRHGVMYELISGRHIAVQLNRFVPIS